MYIHQAIWPTLYMIKALCLACKYSTPFSESTGTIGQWRCEKYVTAGAKCFWGKKKHKYVNVSLLFLMWENIKSNLSTLVACDQLSLSWRNAHICYYINKQRSTYQRFQHSKWSTHCKMCFTLKALFCCENIRCMFVLDCCTTSSGQSLTLQKMPGSTDLKKWAVLSNMQF